MGRQPDFTWESTEASSVSVAAWNHQDGKFVGIKPQVSFKKKDGTWVDKVPGNGFINETEALEVAKGLNAAVDWWNGVKGGEVADVVDTAAAGTSFDDDDIPF